MIVKKLYTIAIVAGICVLFFSSLKAESIQPNPNPFKNTPGVRKIINIDKGWKFHEGMLSNKAQRTGYDDSNWKSVNLPHDWRIHDKYSKNNRRLSGYLPKGIGWYRKKMPIKSKYSGKRVYLSFSGCFKNCYVWVNGKKAGSHFSGYTPFVFDITKLVNFHGGKNVLTVKVDNIDKVKQLKLPLPGSEYRTSHEGWWYEGYGLYRQVKLIVTSPIHVSTWGVFVHTEDVSRKSAVVKMHTSITNNTEKNQNITLKTLLFDPDGNRVNVTSKKDKIGRNSKAKMRQKMVVHNPKLWSPAHPNLYTVVTKIISDGALVDEYKSPLGIRWFKFTANNGFFLNGKRLELRGMNIHAGFGGLGTALPPRANFYDVKLMKKMGVNIIRSAHNDPSPSLIRACDRLGMLLWSETRILGSDSLALSTLDAMILKDRNHPSIIIWSLANNSGRNNPKLTKILQVMNAEVKKLDPTRPTAFASEANGDPNKTGFAFVTDIMGYNGGGMGREDRDHALYPNRKMLTSEYSSGRGIRGVYKTKWIGKPKIDTLGDGRIVKSGPHLAGEYALARSHEKEWTHIAKRHYLAGGMMWSGIEYIGESPGWPVVTSEFGVFDVARFKKDAYFYYLQQWTKKPMVHIMPDDWNWANRDSTIKVWVYSNCKKAELFLNGKSLGIKKKVPLGHIEWDVPYQPGTLRAKGYNAYGSVVAETEVKTAGKPYQLKASADRRSIKANGMDLSFITVSVRDTAGTIVPHADNLIYIDVTGGKLLGMSSGNPVSHKDPDSEKMKAFNGKLRVIVQSYDRKGKIKVKMRSKGLKSTLITIKAQ